MYTIEVDGTIIYNTINPSDKYKLISPTLELADNEAGTLSFTLPPTNIGYDLIEKMVSTVTVYKDGNWLWAGRVINDSVDFYNQKSVECEGVLAFLNDTHQESITYANTPISVFIQQMLNVHNNKVSANRRIALGRITVDDGLKDRYSEYELTIEAFNDLITDNDGHMYITYSGSSYLLNYVKDFNPSNSQYIKFGKNLLDYTKETNLDNFASVILPLGKEDENGDRITVKSVNQGSIYVVNQDAVNKYGWIEKMYDSSEIESPSVLLSYARGLLTKSIVEDVNIEISAIDLHHLDNNIESINLLDTVRVISPYHNIDESYPVTELSLDLADPGNDTFTLGESESRTLTAKTDSISESIYKKINDIPSESSILSQAKANATALINSATTGYVTVRPNAIYISNNEDYTASTKLWTWNINGLGYSNDGGQTYGLAITMDGAIVADYITVGTLSADRVRTGTIESTNGYTNWNLNTGVFTMRGGRIQLGTDYGSSAYPYLRYSINLSNQGMFSRSSSFYGYLANGTIFFGRPDDTNGTIEHTGYIDGTANIHYLVDDTYLWGLNIVAPSRGGSAGESIIRLVSDRISVSNSNDTSATSINTVKEGYIHVLNQADNLVYNLRFINGLLVTSLPSS